MTCFYNLSFIKTNSLLKGTHSSDFTSGAYTVIFPYYVKQELFFSIKLIPDDHE